jgi:hypothetical protein
MMCCSVRIFVFRILDQGQVKERDDGRKSMLKDEGEKSMSKDEGKKSMSNQEVS